MRLLQQLLIRLGQPFYQKYWGLYIPRLADSPEQDLPEHHWQLISIASLISLARTFKAPQRSLEKQCIINLIWKIQRPVAKIRQTLPLPEVNLWIRICQSKHNLSSRISLNHQ